MDTSNNTYWNSTLVCDVQGQYILVNGSTFNGTINGIIPKKCAIYVDTGTAYGYIPNLAVNVTGAVLFFLILVVQLGLGFFARDWWMFGTWGLASVIELLTYIGRSIGHKYPDSDPMFEMQLVCSIIGPAFMAAGLYYLLAKQITLYGEKYSPLAPGFYTAVFATADVISLIIQGVGGGIAASNIVSPYGPDSGGWIMVGGIAFQVIILSIFLCFWGIINWHIFTDDPKNWDPKFAEHRQRPLFKYFVPSVNISLLFLQTRSIYRIIELSVGWEGYLMNTEVYFVVLDGLMIVLGMLPLCIFYPKICIGDVQVRRLSLSFLRFRRNRDYKDITHGDTIEDTNRPEFEKSC